MEAKSKWLTEDGNIVAPNTMDSCVFGSDGQSLNEKLPFKFGIDENGKYGYYKTNEEMVTPFGTGDAGSSGLGDCELIWSGLTELDTSQHELTLDKSIDDYDYLLVSYWNLANSNENSYSNNILIPKSDFYLTSSINGDENKAFSVGENLSGGSVIYLTFRFIDNKTLTYRNGTTSDGYRTAIRAIYGIRKAGLHNYSTEEKVVGTWIDGRPIFERTWQIDNADVTNNWDVTNVDFENIAFVVEATIYDTDSETPRSVPVKTRKLSRTSIRFYAGDSWASIDAYTIQYVKTTDNPTT